MLEKDSYKNKPPTVARDINIPGNFTLSKFAPSRYVEGLKLKEMYKKIEENIVDILTNYFKIPHFQVDDNLGLYNWSNNKPANFFFILPSSSPSSSSSVSTATTNEIEFPKMMTHDKLCRLINLFYGWLVLNNYSSTRPEECLQAVLNKNFTIINFDSISISNSKYILSLTGQKSKLSVPCVFVFMSPMCSYFFGSLYKIISYYKALEDDEIKQQMKKVNQMRIHTEVYTEEFIGVKIYASEFRNFKPLFQNDMKDMLKVTLTARHFQDIYGDNLATQVEANQNNHSNLTEASHYGTRSLIGRSLDSDRSSWNIRATLQMYWLQFFHAFKTLNNDNNNDNNSIIDESHIFLNLILQQLPVPNPSTLLHKLLSMIEITNLDLFEKEKSSFFKFRDYQIEDLNYIKENGSKRKHIVLSRPCGSGKSLYFEFLVFLFKKLFLTTSFFNNSNSNNGSNKQKIPLILIVPTIILQKQVCQKIACAGTLDQFLRNASERFLLVICLESVENHNNLVHHILHSSIVFVDEAHLAWMDWRSSYVHLSNILTRRRSLTLYITGTGHPTATSSVSFMYLHRKRILLLLLMSILPNIFLLSLTIRYRFGN